MKRSPFLYFLILEFKTNIKKHLDIIALSTILLLVLTAVMVTMASYQKYIEELLQSKPDFILKNSIKGQRVPLSWIDKLYEIKGVSDIAPREYLNYKGVTLFGLDFLEDNPNKSISKLIKSINLKEFLSSDYILLSKETKRELNLKDSLKIGSKELKIYKIPKELEDKIPKSTILLQIETLQEIFNLDENSVRDVAFSVPNDDEWDMVESKVNSLSFSSLAITKRDITKAYSKMFGFKGGFFLLLYLIVVAIFCLILYSRYNQLHSQDKRVIGLLKGLGWSIRDILLFKLLEATIVVVISLILGIGAGYLILSLGAKSWFVGIFSPEQIEFDLIVDSATIFSIILIYAVSSIASVLFPLWRVAITPPKEAME